MGVFMDNEKVLEAKLMGRGSFEIEKEIEDELQHEINEARKNNEKAKQAEKKIITDYKKVKPHERFDKNTIYRVYNRKLKNETFVNGEQAENMLKYTDDYVIRFYQRVAD
jgi:hypothetical protein